MVPSIITVKAIVSAAAAILTTATVHNTVETISIIYSSTKIPNQNNDNYCDFDSESILNQYITPIQNDNGQTSKPMECTNYITAVPKYKSKKDVLYDLKCMKRKELLTLFKHCDNNQIIVADRKDRDVKSHQMYDKIYPLIQGEWNGMLLHNNLVLNRQWHGKEFNKIQKDKYIGFNRFIDPANKDRYFNEHSFDYSIIDNTSKPSSLFCNDKNRSLSSIQLKYERYQGKLSLWRTMVDEVRLLKVPIVDDDNYDNNKENKQGEKEKFDIILLGLGSMAWSGGMYNCQPFCLYRP